MKKKINNLGIIGIRGLPPRYGAFDQHTDNLISYSNKINDNKIYYVLCDKFFVNNYYQYKNCVRIFQKRGSGFFLIISNLVGIIRMYLNGVRKFIFYGYSMAFIFLILKIFGCQIVCNVDGIEWRRSITKIKKIYFKFCEKMAVFSKAKLIFDSHAIQRYYSLKYKKKGNTIFYASNLNLLNKKKKSKKIFLKCFIPMRFLKENNIDIIVDTIIKFKNIKLFLSGLENDYFLNKIKPKIIKSKNIFYLGAIYDRKKLESYWNCADFYIHGHSVGGTNPTLIEAISLKKPIISYDVIFNRLILKKNCYYFKNQQDLENILFNENYLNHKNIEFDKNFKIENIHFKTINLFDF